MVTPQRWVISMATVMGHRWVEVIHLGTVALMGTEVIQHKVGELLEGRWPPLQMELQVLGRL